jgi:hypothetical protein
LWLKYVEQIGYDKLLFRSEDFQLPAQSPLRYDLTALGSTDLTALTEKLFALAQARMEDVPPLGQLANSYAEVERQLVAGNWDTAVELLNRRGHFRDAPRRLQPLIYQAYEHVCRQQAWAKFAKIPPESNEEIDRQLVEAWNEALFANFPPAEQARPRVEQARRHVQALDRLRHLIQRTAGRVSLAGEKNLAALAAQLPQGYRHGLQQRADLAARRITAFARLEQTMTQPATEAAIVAAWQAIVAAQCQSLVSIEWGMRIALAEERVTIFQHLAKIPRKVPLPERDRRILALWKEPLMADCPEADPWRPIYQMAAVRREVLKRLQAAIEAHDDAAVLQWGGKRCLAKFPLPKDWIAAIRAARERLGRTESQLAALAEASQAAVNGSSATAEPADEALNVATGEDLPAAANGPATAEPATSPPAAPAQAPPEALGGTGAIAGACAGTGETPVPPAADAPATAELPQSPIPNPQSPIPAAPDALPSALHEQFDVRIVRAQAERFVPYQAFLSEWIRAELLDPQQLGLALPADQPALAPVEQPEGNYRAQWAWPEPRLADQCLLAVCPAEPVCDEDPQQLAAHWRASVSHDEWSAGGGLLIPVERGWEGCWVALWAVVDAGFQKFVSRPLVLGTIESRFRWKWPRLFSRRSEEEKV